MAKYRLILLASICSCLGFIHLNSQAEEFDYSRKAKQVEILSRILETALESDSEKYKGPRAHFDATYLARQGLILEVHPSSGANNVVMFGRSVAGFEPIELYIEQTLEGLDERIMTEAIVEKSRIEALIERADKGDLHKVDPAPPADPEAPEVAPIVTTPLSLDDPINEHGREAYQSFSEKMRSISENIRQKAREVQEATRQWRQSDRSKASEQKRDAAKQALQEAKKSFLDAKREMKNKVNNFKKARQDQQDKVVKMLAHDVVSTLCDYGSALKFLDDNEKVSLIFKGVSWHKGEERDRIYIIEKNAIDKCLNGKIPSHDLLVGSINYFF